MVRRESSTPRFLHVANGTCTTDLIEAAAIPGLRSIWADPLYEGPVPDQLSDADLRELRAHYLSGSTGDRHAGTMNDLKRWRQVIDAHESYDELVLWFEHDLFDQLNLIQLLSWLRHRLPEGKVVSLICIGSFPGHVRFAGLGELSPSELASLLAKRQRVSDAAYTLAQKAWQAFRAPTPELLDTLRQSDTAALPYLAPALERFLQEYPSTIDGLSRTERRLLGLAADGPTNVRAAFPRMHDEEHAYYITDSSFASLVATLSQTSPALVTVAGATAIDGHSLSGTVTLTEPGREVLAGARDRVQCGLDRWLGGVHLQSGINIWRWDAERRRMTRQ